MARSVLIVDDDGAFRRLARRLLAAAGLRVVGEAGTLAEARAAATRLHPDVALVDVGLPDGSGVELARELAALAWAPRVLLTSADDDAGVALDAGDGPAVPFVPKADLPGAPLDRLIGDGADGG